MNEQKITADMKVAEVVKQYPETIEVFLGKGCPDMRTGVVKFMAKIMSVKAAARVHRIPLEALLRDLNAAAKPRCQVCDAGLAAPGEENRDVYEDAAHSQ